MCRGQRSGKRGYGGGGPFYRRDNLPQHLPRFVIRGVELQPSPEIGRRVSELLLSFPHQAHAYQRAGTLWFQLQSKGKGLICRLESALAQSAVAQSDMSSACPGNLRATSSKITFAAAIFPIR
jgi:hypothetical protein